MASHVEVKVIDYQGVVYLLFVPPHHIPELSVELAGNVT